MLGGRDLIEVGMAVLMEDMSTGEELDAAETYVRKVVAELASTLFPL